MLYLLLAILTSALNTVVMRLSEKHISGSACSAFDLKHAFSVIKSYLFKIDNVKGLCHVKLE